MDSVSEALAFLRKQRDTGSTAWHNMCESLQRQAYGLPAHYSSANLHADAIPASRRYGHERPSRGDLVLMKNSTYGHIVTCEPSDAHPWSGWTNDYGGRGKVTRVNDVRDLVPWCGASSWFVADAWWSSSNSIPTHRPPTPPPTPPDPQPTEELDMLLIQSKDTNGIYLLTGNQVSLIADPKDRDALKAAGVVGPVVLTPATFNAIAAAKD